MVDEDGIVLLVLLVDPEVEVDNVLRIFGRLFPDTWKAHAVEILENEEPFDIKHLSITGNDLIALGYKGKEIGTALEDALMNVMIKPELNKDLIKVLKRRKAE